MSVMFVHVTVCQQVGPGRVSEFIGCSVLRYRHRSSIAAATSRSQEGSATALWSRFFANWRELDIEILYGERRSVYWVEERSRRSSRCSSLKLAFHDIDFRKRKRQELFDAVETLHWNQQSRKFFRIDFKCSFTRMKSRNTIRRYWFFIEIDEVIHFNLTLRHKQPHAYRS
jgi:hypothetical protein